MLYIMSKFEALKSDRRGVTALEYGVIAAVIIGVVATAFTALGTNLSAKINGLITTLG